MTIRRRVARWFSKAACAQAHARSCAPTTTHARTHTHTVKYVTRFAFPRQQWFRERTSILRYTYIACLVTINTQLCFTVSFDCMEVLFRYEFLKAVLLKIQVFWVVTPCLWDSSSRRFEGQLYGWLQSQAVFSSLTARSLKALETCVTTETARQKTRRLEALEVLFGNKVPDSAEQQRCQDMDVILD